MAKLLALCKRCGGDVEVTTFRSASKEECPPGIYLDEDRGYCLIGGCPHCEALLSRVLKRSVPFDRELIQAYKTASNLSEEQSIVPVAKDNDKAQGKGGPIMKRHKKKKAGQLVGKVVKRKVSSGATPKRRAAQRREGSEALQVTKSNYPLKIFAMYGPRGEEKTRFDAIMRGPDEIEFDGAVYTSASMAAVRITGSRVNGQQFWKYVAGKDKKGKALVQPISDLRPEGAPSRAMSSTPKPKQPPRDIFEVDTKYDSVKAVGKIPKRMAMYFVSPLLWAKYQQVNVYRLVKDHLVHVRYTKDGEAIEKSREDLGGPFTSITGEDCKDVLGIHARSKRLKRVKLVK